VADTPLLDELTALEQLLHDPAARRNPTQVALLLADEFREFGKSGRVYDKPAILQLLADEPPGQPPILADEFALTAVSTDAALLTYRSTSAGTTAVRSSLWVHRDGRWQMLFHQGTKSSPYPDEPTGFPPPGVRR
jgi:hypothetical protein